MIERKPVAIFCSASELDSKYTAPAEEFAILLARNGFEMVYGGTDKGLMKLMADVFQNSGSRVIGISIPTYHPFARQSADEMMLTQTLGERKAQILERSKAIIGLVGGIGTLDEITEMIELRKQEKHTKPIVILNSEGFYEGLKVQLQKMKNEGFFTNNIDDLIHFADTPNDAINYLLKNLFHDES